MNIEFNQNELKILTSALDAKVKDQWTKLSNPHLDGQHVAVYQSLHQDTANLHTKISRLALDAGRVGQDVHKGPLPLREVE